ncbi:MAG TPA: OsmC family protein [Terriglobales bacterium]|nr:OsmC family protein [Terriglobales bacterium]
MTDYRYKVDAHWTEGRRGRVLGEGVTQDLDFSAPPEFQGEIGFWTPEHFFVAAVSSCFVATFAAIAEMSKFEALDLEVSAVGTLAKSEGGFRFTDLELRPVLTVAHEHDRDRGMRLLEKAERSCLVTRSLSTPVRMQALVRVAETVAV